MPDGGSFTCKSCQVTKPIDDFYATATGHRHECKKCIRAKRKERYAQNREANIDYSTQWNREHRDRHNEVHRASYRRNKDYHRERLARWREENPEKWKAQQKRALEIERRRGFPNAAKRRARMSDAWVEHVEKRVVYEVCEGMCGICEEPVSYKAATLDHLVPLSRGGLHCYANIQVAHGYCNRRKGSRLMEEMTDEMRYASVPKKKKAYYNSRSYRQANTDQRRAA